MHMVVGERASLVIDPTGQLQVIMPLMMMMVMMMMMMIMMMR